MITLNWEVEQTILEPIYSLTEWLAAGPHYAICFDKKYETLESARHHLRKPVG